MKGTSLLFSALLICCLTGSAAAQEVASAMEEAVAEYAAWMDVIVDLTSGVEFDESDVRSFLDHWEGMDALDLGEDEDEGEGAAGFKQNVREILADPRYLDWASTNGLDPARWMKKAMRISTVVMRRQLEAQREMMDSQKAEYEAMIEQQCAQVDAESCKAMRDMMMASLAMGEAMIEAMDKLPPPTAAESELLDTYGSDLEALLMDDDEDYEDYDDDEDW